MFTLVKYCNVEYHEITMNNNFTDMILNLFDLKDHSCQTQYHKVFPLVFML